MEIFAISVVKNEADIVRASLLEASKWASKIFVLDNGSTDGTWEIVQSLANEIIVPWKQDFQPFYKGIRGFVFNEFRHLAKENDWWCFRLDADEFYLDDPGRFLCKVPWYCGQVYKRSIDFVLTKEDIGERTTHREFVFPQHGFKYVNPTAWCELRFFKHTKNVYWPENSTTPVNLKMVYSRKITVFHFQYRSITQLKRRIIDRLDNKKRTVPKDGEALWMHIENEDWENYIVAKDHALPYKGSRTHKALKEVNAKPYPTLLHKLYHLLKSLMHRV